MEPHKRNQGDKETEPNSKDGLLILSSCVILSNSNTLDRLFFISQMKGA